MMSFLYMARGSVFDAGAGAGAGAGAEAGGGVIFFAFFVSEDEEESFNFLLEDFFTNGFSVSVDGGDVEGGHVVESLTLEFLMGGNGGDVDGGHVVDGGDSFFFK